MIKIQLVHGGFPPANAMNAAAAHIAHSQMPPPPSRPQHTTTAPAASTQGSAVEEGPITLLLYKHASWVSAGAIGTQLQSIPLAVLAGGTAHGTWYMVMWPKVS